jgi:thiamine-phosphate pyrophosphorylase
MPARKPERDLGLYVVTDEGLSRGQSHSLIARLALEGGADAIQLRDKSMGGRALMVQALKIRRLTKEAGKLFTVNDRLDIALACGADGVHLGQEDMALADARMLAPRPFIIGITVHDVDEAKEAGHGGADYVGLSPIFVTGSKADAGAACGVEMIRAVKSAVSVPVVAIGGIGPSNAREVLEAGADGLAVISAVVGQPDIVAAARRLKAVISEYRKKTGQPWH